jgi:hypothetical protein
MQEGHQHTIQAQGAKEACNFEAVLWNLQDGTYLHRKAKGVPWESAARKSRG